MKPEPSTTLYPSDDCMIDGFSEKFPMCQLVRDESFGWPLQDPELDADPFNSKLALDFDLNAFESTATSSKEWTKEPLTPIPEAAWQRLVQDIKSPTRLCSPDTSLTPALAALEFPKGPMPEELSFTSLAGRQSSCESYPQKMEESASPCEPSYLPAKRLVAADDYNKNNTYSSPAYLAQDMFMQQQQQQQQQQPQRVYFDGGYGTVLTNPPTGDVITIGIYTRTERAAKLFRYRQKRARRNYTKRVLYGCRKRFADSRPRVGGRFVINENRVIKPKTFLKRGRPRKLAVPLMNYLASSFLD